VKEDDGRAAKLREEAANMRQKAQSVADYAERQTMLLQASMLEDMADVEERWHRSDTERRRSATGDNGPGGNGLPRPVQWFQLLWFGGMVIGAVYDLAVAVVGDHVEAWIDILLFVMAGTLMHYAVRRRSHLARLSLIPFLLVTIVEVFSHDGYIAFDVTETCLAVVQLGLMVGAVWLLFTPAARDWYLRSAHRT
jgi:hypothetical protein